MFLTNNCIQFANEVTTSMNSISSQTNLFALNVSTEMVTKNVDQGQGRVDELISLIQDINSSTEDIAQTAQTLLSEFNKFRYENM